MNTDYDRCRALYRAAWLQERASPADRHAVRLALTTAVTAGVHAATVGASAAAPAIAGMSAAGSKGILQLVLGGKFISGLLVGAALGSAGFATSVAVQSRETSTRGQEVTHRQDLRQQPQLAPRGVRPVANSACADAELELDRASDVAPASPNLNNVSPNLNDASPNLNNVSPNLTDASPSRPHPVQRAVDVTAPSQHPLTEETTALANVQAALNRRDATLALTLLDAQERSYARGQLGEERAAAKVLALCSAGRIREAEAARSAFIVAHPTSPLTKRVTLGCSAQ